MTFQVVSYIEAACVLICFILCIIFQPAYINKTVYTQESYFGSFSRGFSKNDNIFESTNLILTEYSIETATQFSYESPEVVYKDPAVIFLSDIGTMSADSALKLSSIAEQGVTVLTGDFFTPDAPKTGTNSDFPINTKPVFRNFSLRHISIEDKKNNQGFFKQKELELATLLSFATQKYSSVLIVAEGESRQIALEARKNYPDFVLGVFSTTGEKDVDSYYSFGFGDVVVLNPFDSYFILFENASEYREQRNFALKENPELTFSQAVLQRIKALHEDRQNDTK